MNSKNTTTLAAILTIAVLAIGTMQFAAAGGNETKLEGVFDSVDDGKAKFESKDGRMKFSVEITDSAVVDGASYDIAVSGQIFSATAIGNIIELDLDSQCNDGPTDNNCWLNPVELSGTVTVTGPGISASATLQNK
jgi:hypothetical protein